MQIRAISAHPGATQLIWRGCQPAVWLTRDTGLTLLPDHLFSPPTPAPGDQAIAEISTEKRDLKGIPLTDSMIQWPTDKVFGVKLFPNIWLRWHAGSWNIIPQNSRLSWSTKEKLNHIRVLRQFYSDLWYLTRRACHNSWEGGEEGRHGKWLTWINQHFDHQSVGHTNTWLPHGHTYIWSDISHTSAMICRILSSIAWSYVHYMKITNATVIILSP